MGCKNHFLKIKLKKIMATIIETSNQTFKVEIMNNAVYITDTKTGNWEKQSFDFFGCDTDSSNDEIIEAVKEWLND